jgi:hypothetical protein
MSPHSRNYLTKSFISAITLSLSLSVTANNISSEQVIADITYLAGDELKGRASFSPEIDKAAQYISQRFEKIGLSPFGNNTSFKQSFSITSITPKNISVTINDQVMTKQNIALASTMASINWQNKEKVAVSVIGKDDDMRQVVRNLNQQGGQHLVLINSAHAKTFAGYQSYFNRGLTKLSLQHQGALVLILTDDTTVSSMNILANLTIETKTLTNVVGVLPGKKSPQEIVLYSSHYDHLGTTEDGKAIYNGADDDASGTTAVINLAQYYATKGNNNRTLVFSAFTAEEIGGFGSQYFSKQLNPDDVVAMINIEMIGKPSKFGPGKVWMTGMERSNLGELLNNNLKPLNTEVFQDPYPEQGLFYRSDNATLARLGVPAHSFSSTQLDKDQHYHQVSDDISSLDLQSMYQVIESLSVATQGLVDGVITPTRVDVEQIRAQGKIY